MINRKQLKQKWNELNKNQWFRQFKNILRKLVVVAIAALILYQIIEIGWKEVLTSLPQQPMFYVLLLFIFLSLPVTEIFIYRQLWPVKRWDAFKAFLTKRVYNDEVAGYSGEFYLYLWARKRVDLDNNTILKNIRDNNIISAVNSNIVAFSIVGFLVFSGRLEVFELIGDVNIIYVITAAVIVAILVIVFIQFRKYLFDLPLKTSLVIFSFYMIRFVIHNTLYIIQWSIVFPDTPLNVWFTFLAVVIIVNRLPLIPSKDLLFVWAGIELSRMFDMATASVAGMLLVASAISKVMNLILLLVLNYYSEIDMKKIQEEAEGNEVI